MTPKLTAGQRVVEELKNCGVTHVIWLADSKCKFMYGPLMAQPGIQMVPVCRESECMAIALGLILGGKKPVVLHQNSGLYACGESIRTLGKALHLPLLMLIGDIGWKRDAPQTDSHAFYLEPFLDTWDIKHYYMDTEDDIKNISKGYQEALDTKNPVAILIRGEFE